MVDCCRKKRPAVIHGFWELRVAVKSEGMFRHAGWEGYGFLARLRCCRIHWTYTELALGPYLLLYFFLRLSCAPRGGYAFIPNSGQHLAIIVTTSQSEEFAVFHGLHFVPAWMLPRFPLSLLFIPLAASSL